jgi:transposase-like protein
MAGAKLEQTGHPAVYRRGERFVYEWVDAEGKHRRGTTDTLEDAVRLKAERKAIATGSVDDLKVIANDEFEHTVAVLKIALDHAIRCGEALLSLKVKVPEGGWGEWVKANFAGSLSTAERYMRFAQRQHLLAGCETLTEADERLIGLPRTNGRVYATDESVQREAVALYKRGGLSLDAVGERFGVTGSTVHYWLNRPARERTQAIVKDAERRRAMKERGGTVSVAWGLLRRSAQKLHAACDDAGSEKARLESAYLRLREVEDEIYEIAMGAA